MATIRPKPDVVLMAAGMRTAAKPLAGLADVLEGVHVTGCPGSGSVNETQRGRDQAGDPTGSDR